MSDIYIVKNFHTTGQFAIRFQRMNGLLTPPHAFTHSPLICYSTMIAFNQQYIHQRESALAWSSPQGIPQAGSSWGRLLNKPSRNASAEWKSGGLRRGGLSLNTALHCSATFTFHSPPFHYNLLPLQSLTL